MKNMLVTKTFHFDSAHHLTNYHGKCERVHGHTYRLDVTVQGPIQKQGIVVDFALLKSVVQRCVLDILDHRDLNDVFKNSTAEHIVLWIWKTLLPLSKLLKKMASDKKYLEEIQFFYSDKKNIRPNQTNFSRVKLYEIRLFEGKSAFISYRG